MEAAVMTPEPVEGFDGLFAVALAGGTARSGTIREFPPLLWSLVAPIASGDAVLIWNLSTFPIISSMMANFSSTFSWMAENSFLKSEMFSIQFDFNCPISLPIC
ncbi:hypothetical protein M5K25_017640 [Dendrobium thyrsiflorum]|uniref:Uncharacterized protein n=1 Tax=Dendrobium thyrsiflorum TaxID=117978 RepID=A0ABD0UMT1_DENTH